MTKPLALLRQWTAIIGAAAVAATLLCGCGALGSDGDGSENGDPAKDAKIPVPPDSDAVVHARETIDRPVNWGKTHKVTGVVNVQAKLTISSCTEIYFTRSGMLRVEDGGKLVVKGTDECPVVMSGPPSEDSVWSGIDILGTADTGSSFKYTEFHQGGEQSHSLLWIGQGTSVSVEHSTFRDVGGSAVFAKKGARLEAFSNNTFVDVDKHPVELWIDQAPKLENMSLEDVERPTVRVRGKKLEESVTFVDPGIAYEVPDLSITAEVIVLAGTEFRFRQLAGWEFKEGGTLEVKGKRDNPVVFSSAAKNPEPGDWSDIGFEQSAGTENSIEWATIEYGGSIGQALYVHSDSGLRLNWVTFKNNESCDLRVENGAAFSKQNSTTNNQC